MYDLLPVSSAFVPSNALTNWCTGFFLFHSSKKRVATLALLPQREACDANVVLTLTFVALWKDHRPDPKLPSYPASAIHSLVCRLLPLPHHLHCLMQIASVLTVVYHLSTPDVLRHRGTSVPIHFAVRPRLRVLRRRI